MNYKILEYKNEILFKESELFADNITELLLKLAPNSPLKYGNEIIKSLKLKDTDIDVHISTDGVFFYFSIDGEEVTIDDLSMNWLLEPVGTYHAHILKQLDVTTLVIVKLE